MGFTNKSYTSKIYILKVINKKTYMVQRYKDVMKMYKTNETKKHIYRLDNLKKINALNHKLNINTDR